MSESEDEEQGLVAKVKHGLIVPLHIATSKSAQKAYITSFLFASTSIFLFVLAVTAYILFYWSFIPRIGFTRPVHLQFDPHNLSIHPWGVATLTPDLVSAQGYDVTVHLRLPRTRENTHMGNFMLDVTLFAPSDKAVAANPTILDAAATAKALDATKILARSSRSAILTYYSPVVELARRASELHWLWLGWRDEAESLEIRVFDGVAFAKGWRNVPATLRLDVQSQTRMQIYEAKVVFKAKFRGLRWVMYNHRVFSAGLFIGVFWGTEMVTMALAWLVFSYFVFPGPKQDVGVVKKEEEGEEDESTEKARIKQEEHDDQAMDRLSDTERTFPSYGAQPALRYRSPSIKKEESSEMPLPPAFPGGEADDEDEDADFALDEPGRRSDSGLGTSMESSSSRKDAGRRRRVKASRYSDAPS